MSERHLQSHLLSVAGRYRRLAMWRGFVLCWIVPALIGVVLGVMAWQSAARPPRLAVPVLVVLALGLAFLAALRSRFVARNLRWVAQQIEGQHQDLDTRLLAAYEQDLNVFLVEPFELFSDPGARGIAGKYAIVEVSAN